MLSNNGLYLRAAVQYVQYVLLFLVTVTIIQTGFKFTELPALNLVSRPFLCALDACIL